MLVCCCHLLIYGAISPEWTSTKNKIKRNKNPHVNNKNMLSRNRNGIWHWKICHANNEKWEKRSNGRKITAR